MGMAMFSELKTLLLGPTPNYMMLHLMELDSSRLKHLVGARQGSLKFAVLLPAPFWVGTVDLLMAYFPDQMDKHIYLSMILFTSEIMLIPPRTVGV